MPRVQQPKLKIVKMVRRVIDLIYPPQCACCRADVAEAEAEVDLCEECRKRLIPLIWTPCPRCGGLAEGTVDPQKGCASCAATRFHFDGAVAIGSYHPALKQAITRMKIESGAPLAAAMGRLLAAERREILENLHLDIVIPIPMHWWHRAHRRLNNPDIIAYALAKSLAIPCRRWLLVRRKKTRTQSELPPKQRFVNVQGRISHALRRKDQRPTHPARR